MRKAPEFWWDNKPSALSLLLYPLSQIYGRIAGRRMLAPPVGISKIPVLCIGNFVVGGTGKTPFAISLYELLKKEGFSPIFLLRGYGGTQKGPVLVSRSNHTAADVGDEAMLLAEVGPTVVSSDRVEGAVTARGLDADIIIMDDGFQNASLQKDLSIVLVDADRGIGNGQCLPGGPLRAPMDIQMVKTDLLMVVGKGEGANTVVRRAARRGLKPFHSQLTPTIDRKLSDVPFLAFAGIGQPDKFFRTAEELGLTVRQTQAFPDHHVFSDKEIQELFERARNESLQFLTTAKDLARLKGMKSERARQLAGQCRVLDVRMEIGEVESLIAAIQGQIKQRAFSN
ncbi:MAG: tetraacyldisaccharide 4'-kinase [Stappiaceae bacterium]